MDIYRPRGVIALAITFIVLAILEIIGGILYETSVIATEYQLADFTLYSAFMIYLQSPTPPGWWLGPLLSVFDYLSLINILHIVVAIILIFSVLLFVSGIGLLYMKKWGYNIALIIGILSIIGGIFGLLVLIGIIPLIFGIIVVVYLMGDVKYEFE